MKILVACEFSGIVRDAFIAQGHDAVSCDIEPSEKPGPHIQDDIRDIDLSAFDIKIAHPPCTYLCNSGRRWIKERGLYQEQEEAVAFFMWFVEHGFNAIENPVGIMSTRYKKPSQIIHPWQYGIRVKKATCLWLHELPLLQPTNIVEPYYSDVHYASPSKDRSKERSRTYKGIANAMSTQW